eukprot:2107043-Rhodomonas_salina.2
MSRWFHRKRSAGSRSDPLSGTLCSSATKSWYKNGAEKDSVSEGWYKTVQKKTQSGVGDGGSVAVGLPYRLVAAYGMSAPQVCVARQHTVRWYTGHCVARQHSLCPYRTLHNTAREHALCQYQSLPAYDMAVPGIT